MIMQRLEKKTAFITGAAGGSVGGGVLGGL